MNTAEIITIRKAPSVDRVLTAVGRYGRHQHFGERMTGEEAHRAAAVIYAANLALRMDKLGASWRNHRHLAAKCGELFDRLISDEAYTRSNMQFQVDISFA